MKRGFFFTLDAIIAVGIIIGALSRKLQASFRFLPMLDTSPGLWERSGRLREHGYRPKLADTLIAQACIDYRTPLLTRDRDFQPFAKHSKLVLVLPA